MADPLRPSLVPTSSAPTGQLKSYQERLFTTGFRENEVVGRHRPHRTAKLDIGQAFAIESMRDHIVVAGDEIRFVNVSAPGEPYVAASMDVHADVVDFTTTGEHLYVSTGRDGPAVISGWAETH